MQIQKRILVSPLNWGLGHATRCIPIIRLLIKNNAQVIIAAEGKPLEVLKQEFPDLETITFKGISINYTSEKWMHLKLFISIPKILLSIYREHQQLRKIISEHKIDLVIADNRYGLWNKNIKSIFVCHQLFIKSPLAEKLLQRINLFFINKFDECWIPDHEGKDNLSGDLAHNKPLPASAFFIGPLSRFEEEDNTKAANFTFDVLAVVSGPEPQRSIFEKIILEQLLENNIKATLVCGKPDIPFKEEKIKNVSIYSHLNSTEMKKTIQQAEFVISRSGYSSIMDMAALEKKCIFIPTPGQTEQEYLAEKLMEENIAFSQKQSAVDLKKGLKEMGSYSGFRKVPSTNLLERKVKGLLNELTFL